MAATDARIPEHGIVDPETKTITVLTLDGGEDKTHGELRAGQTATPVPLEGFRVDVAACVAAAVVDESSIAEAN